MQNLSDKYNVRMIRTYGAAGYGKGLIYVIPSFGAKAILRRDIVTKCIWFQNISTIYDYLESRCDSRMSYFNFGEKIINQKRLTKEGFKIKGCMSQHILCNCEECLQLNFSSCPKELLQKVHMDERDG